MDQLFYDYLPIAIFIGVALFIALALMAVPFVIAVNNLTRRRSRPTSAASTPSMMRA